MRFLVEIKCRFYLIFYVWFYTSIICYYYKEYIYLFLINILILTTSIPIFYYFIITNITEIFKIYFKIIEFFNLQIMSIYFIYHIFLFLAPACYKKEFYIYKTMIFTIFFCWIFNSFLSILLVFPLSWSFFESFQFLLIKNFSLEVKINEFLLFFLKTYFFTQFYFLSFILVFFIFKNLYNKYFVKKFRKFYYFMFLFFLIVISLIDDLISQLMLWLVFCLLYELLLFMMLFSKKCGF